ncbi:kappa-type opioid receptor-like [Protopterus annectens]|uniref:kappa-type opioid receptor-like n=1 Tax=Protopterus annectens TaxID=7888 RepID=UPI001CF9E0E4|nr:kappa-type opioid receptor-like [Protopterus annectens]
MNSSDTINKTVLHNHMLEISSILSSEKFLACIIASMTVMYCLTLVVNGSVLTTVLGSDYLIWQPQVRLLANLLLCDLILTTTLVLSSIYHLINRRIVTFGTACIASCFVISVCIFSAIGTLAFMAVDRYCYICHAIHYFRIFTPRKLKTGLVCTWLVPFSMITIYVILLAMHEPQQETVYGIVCDPDILEEFVGFPKDLALFRKSWSTLAFFFCIGVFLYCYYKMYIEAKNAVEPFQTSNKKARKRIFFYGTMFSLQLVPYWIKMLIDLLWDYHLASHEAFALLTHIVVPVLMTIPPCINPIIYGYRSQEVRRRIPGINLHRIQPVMNAAWNG